MSGENILSLLSPMLTGIIIFFLSRISSSMDSIKKDVCDLKISRVEFQAWQRQREESESEWRKYAKSRLERLESTHPKELQRAG